MNGRVAGKTALVAGAGGGIGGAGAAGLVREGAAVICADLDMAAAEATPREDPNCRRSGGGCALDVRDRSAARAPRWRRRQASSVRLDVLLDSADGSQRASFFELEPGGAGTVSLQST